MRKLLRGRYYWHRDSSPKKYHPSYIYKKNDSKNRYHIVCFTSSKGRGRTKLNKNINPNSNKDCYVLNNPTISKRRSFGTGLKGYELKDRRDKHIVRMIKRKRK